MNITRKIAAFATKSSSFLSLSSIEEEDKCSICNKTFGKKDKIHSFGVNGWPKLQAEKWSKLKIHKDNNEYVYTLVHSKMNGIEESFGESHRSCKREFDLRYINSATKFGEKNSTKNGSFSSVIFLNYLL